MGRQPSGPSPSPSDGARVPLSYRVYRRSTAAGWIFFVPGAGATAAIWSRQLRFFRRRWNVVVADLRGHGRSPKPAERVVYSFASAAADILEVMDREAIPAAHFVAMSLGSLLVETLARTHPSRVKSMVLAGGIAKMDAWALLFMRLGDLTKHVIPYMGLYRLFAWVIMPGPRHRRTRRLFHSQARRLSEAEFLRWYHLTHEVQSVIRKNAARSDLLPTLYVMGQGDYMFGQHACNRARQRKDTRVAILEGAGHVCNVEQSEPFNRVVLEFLQDVEDGTRAPRDDSTRVAAEQGLLPPY